MFYKSTTRIFLGCFSLCILVSNFYPLTITIANKKTRFSRVKLTDLILHSFQ